jgi:hypothetical protein
VTRANAAGLKTRLAVCVALVICVGAGGLATARCQTASAPVPPSGPPIPYVPSMGDMMNTLVQPRHAKLGLAGQAQNWPLAFYSLVEIRQVFDGIVKAQPKFHGMPVAELVEAAISRPLNAVETAIKAKDATKFAAAYGQLSQGCNACHTALDHPFVVIKAPDASAFSNQEFGAAR